MSVLVYTESEQGTFKKTAFEVASYAKAVADQMGTTVTAIALIPQTLQHWKTMVLTKYCK